MRPAADDKLLPGDDEDNENNGEANENSVDGASTGDDLEGTSTPFLNTP